MKIHFVWSIAAAALLVPSVASAQLSGPASGPAASATEAEVKTVALALRGDREQLMKMKPTAGQVAQIVATPEDAARLTAYVEKLFASIPRSGLAPSSPEQTEVLVSADLPGGYDRIRSKLKPGIAIYGFKYVAPGQTSGMAFDGLIKVDGQWVIIPKLWRAFAE